MIEVTAIKCRHCRDVIFSRTRHDNHSCSCGKIWIDGGFEYIRFGWPGGKEPPPKQFKLEIEETVTDLYHDWNNQENKFGLIHNKKITKFIKFWNKKDKQKCPECDNDLQLINNLYYCSNCNLDIVFKVKLRG
jgi:hypothetical protein